MIKLFNLGLLQLRLWVFLTEDLPVRLQILFSTLDISF